MMRQPDTHGIVFRKYANTLRDSVFGQIGWALEKLNAEQWWGKKVSPMSYTYKPTGQQILFRGLDDPMKIKSIKMPFGYFKYAWFEELDQFDGMEEIGTVIRSIMRGGGKYSYFYTYNPPETSANWVNVESEKAVANRHVHTSCYLDVPRDWLGEAFFTEADLLKLHNERSYKHTYLGLVTGTGGTIFHNLENRPITNSEIANFYPIRNGIDWGFAVDPFVFLRMHYDHKKRTLYIFDEVFKLGMLDSEAIEIIFARGLDGRDLITADNAEPKSIKEFNGAGLYVESARKGPGSVNYGIKWLQKQIRIVIDARRCPNTWREFSLYEYERTKSGHFRSEYPDKDNHTIDAVRYAMEGDMEGAAGTSQVVF